MEETGENESVKQREREMTPAFQQNVIDLTLYLLLLPVWSKGADPLISVIYDHLNIRLTDSHLLYVSFMHMNIMYRNSHIVGIRAGQKRLLPSFPPSLVTDMKRFNIQDLSC